MLRHYAMHSDLVSDVRAGICVAIGNRFATYERTLAYTGVKEEIKA